MCGIIGIIGTKSVADEIYLGLLCLQHRGQDSAGIATFNEKIHLQKGKGLALEVFHAENIKEFSGNLGIGHTRYPTIGSDVHTDAQPLATENFAIAHNGSLTNYPKLRAEFAEKGTPLTSTCDTEAILRLLEEDKDIDIFESVGRIMEKIEGSYSIVAMNKNGLIAFRDPQGIRPLVLGRREDNYIVCSETCVLQSLGYEHIRNIAPGEIIFINKRLKVASKVLKHEKTSHCMFEWVYFSRADSEIEKQSVYETRLELGKRLARKFDKKIDVVIPVPDSGRTAAIAFAEELGVPYREGMIKNRYIGRTFIMENQKKRDSLVNLKLNPIESSLHDLSVAVIDDSIVRGTTSRRIVQVLRNAKAREIHMVSTCPPIMHPCFYGVDMSTRGELIASSKSVEEICRYIGADSLTYCTMEDLYSSIRKENLCTACLTGEYPTKINSAELAQQRSSERLQQNKLKIAILGSGGREHALVWKIKQSPVVEKVYCIPGNAGTAEIAENVDPEDLVKFVQENDIDITVVGPEIPLAEGIVDEFQKKGLKIFGPDKSAARLESSKIFAKEFMVKYDLPTAKFKSFSNYFSALDYLKTQNYPLVIKADGLAAGKGVIIAKNGLEAKLALEKLMLDKDFGEAGSKVIIEEFLEGEELSYMIIMDGTHYQELASSQDHKRIFNDDQGLNTGGMGAYSPAPLMNGKETEIKARILEPLLQGLKQEGINYLGVLYLGLMYTDEGFKILEFNCRFGDPECQVILPRLKTDFVQLLHAVMEGNLQSLKLEWSPQSCVGVVLASQGYPEHYEKGKLINGLEHVEGLVFHAGTKKVNDNFLTAGGRVLSVVKLADSLEEAIRECYMEVGKIYFPGMHFRTDIGNKALRWTRQN